VSAYTGDAPIRKESGSSRSRLLVVDDEPLNLLTFKRVLRLVYDITLASSGTEALVALAAAREETPFDVLIVDYAMPFMNGGDLLARVRQQHADLPCIILTAHADLAEVQAAGRQHGVVAVVMKPWERADLERWVDQSVRIARMKRSIARIRK
jgi:two-component system, NtrC family, nitrogen regulation response regulator GlnG